jgi:hypothetical protein
MTPVLWLCLALVILAVVYFAYRIGRNFPKRSLTEYPVKLFYQLCSFRNGSEPCRVFADTFVVDPATQGKLWRCPEHRGILPDGRLGLIHYSMLAEEPLPEQRSVIRDF